MPCFVRTSYITWCVHGGTECILPRWCWRWNICIATASCTATSSQTSQCRRLHDFTCDRAFSLRMLNSVFFPVLSSVKESVKFIYRPKYRFYQSRALVETLSRWQARFSLRLFTLCYRQWWSLICEDRPVVVNAANLVESWKHDSYATECVITVMAVVDVVVC